MSEDTGKTPSRKAAHWLLAAVLFFFLVAGVWLVAEWLILPKYVNAPSRQAYLMGFCGIPGADVDGTVINSMGFTGDVISQSKPPGTLRILTLGGSAFFNRNMAERLREGLQERLSQHVEVVGGALRQHNSRCSLLKFNHLAGYDFDYVLIYHGINDLDANHVSPEDFRPDYSHFHPFFVRNALLDHSIAARVVYNRFLFKRAETVSMGAGHASERAYEQNLELLVSRVRETGGVPILMTFAWSIPEKYSEEAFEQGALGYNNPEKYNPCPVEMWGSPAYVWEGLSRHNAVTRAVAARLNVPLIDQEKHIGKDVKMFGDPVHLSEEGTESFVVEICRFFRWLNRAA